MSPERVTVPAPNIVLRLNNKIIFTSRIGNTPVIKSVEVDILLTLKVGLTPAPIAIEIVVVV